MSDALYVVLEILIKMVNVLAVEVLKEFENGIQ